jgi:hypothetical protein
MANDMEEVRKLLAKIFFELRDMNARQRRQAGEPEPVRPPSQAGVASIRVERGVVHVTDPAELPSQMSPERQAALAAQRPGGGNKPVARVEPFRRRDEPAIQVDGEVERNFNRR